MAKRLNKNTGKVVDSKWRKIAERGEMFMAKTKYRYLKSPQHLWEVACAYFESMDDDPFNKEEFIRGGERAGEIIKLRTQRPYSWQSFGVFLITEGILYKIDDYKYNRDGRYDEYIEVIQAIDKVMWAQKFEGAAVGAYNANIIQRDLQLAELTATHITGNIKSEVDYSNLSEAALNEILANKKASDEDRTNRA